LAHCGYESVMAPENFFYSHTYDFIRFMPTTLTGAELIYKVNDQLSVNGGLDTGWNNWDSTSDKLSYYFGLNWTSEDKNTTVGLEFFLGNQQPGPVNSTLFLACTYLNQKIG
jgi:hypothetical protein